MTAGFDTETYLIRPAQLAPPMVCLAIATDTGRWLYHVHPERMPQGPRGMPDDATKRKLQQLFKGSSSFREAKPPADTAKGAFEWLLQTQEVAAGLNTAYDLAVCGRQWPDLYPLIFSTLDEDRIIDVGLCQQLIDNAHGKLKYWGLTGGYSLHALEKRILKRDRGDQKKKPNAWRLRYRELEGVDLHEWPKEAVEYALEDAVGAKEIFDAQWASEDQKFLKDAPNQQRAAHALHLMMCWGVMVDEPRVLELLKLAEKRYWELTESLVKKGLVRGDNVLKNLRWTRDTKAAKSRMLEVCRQNNLPIKLTDTGYKKYFAELDRRGIDPVKHGYRFEDMLSPDEILEYTSVDEDACKESGDEILMEYSLRSQLHSVVNTHVPDLLKGVKTPIQPRYTTMVDSGRTACSKSRSEDGKKNSFSPTNGFQFQNPKRAFLWIPPGEKKAVPLFPLGVGIRECFVARHRKLFADNDYSGLELHTGAQACLDTVSFSRLAETLNEGVDPHLDFGASMMGISYVDAKARKHEGTIKYYRQLAKVANFGLPGGLGWRGLIGFARGYGVKLTEAEAKKLIADWFEKYPEWRAYFRWIRDCLDLESGRGDFTQLYVGRVRGSCRYTEACNTFFQGLGADVAKRALYEVQKRCYTVVDGPDSVLYGVRPVGFIHDEILAEVDEELAHEQAFQLAEVMVREGNVYLPDVPVRCVPALSKRWCKDAEAVFNKDGRLQPYDLARDGRWEVYYDQNANEKVKWA
jgi:hypothetical protein